MSPSEHIDDKLVDYAYGELSPSQMREAQTHLQTCHRCTQALDEIRSVQRVMSQLPTVPAPAEGLDSLISYAQQRAEANSKSQPVWIRWRRLVWPLAGALACLALVVISARVVREMGPVSSRLVPERQDAVTLHSKKTREPEEKPLVFFRAPPPAQAQKDSSAERETPYDRSDDLRLKGAGRAADTSPSQEAPGEIAMRKEKRESTEQGPAEPAPASRLAHREEPPPAPPSSAANYAQRPTQARGGVAAKLAGKSEQKVDESDNSVQGGVEGGVVGGVMGGVVGRQPASEEDAVTGQRSQPASPTVGFAQPPRKSEPAGTSESLSREATSVREALNRGAVGLERARLLNRLCEILFALGQELDAIAACDAVLKEFPDTPAAQSAKRLKANFSKASARPAEEKRGP